MRGQAAWVATGQHFEMKVDACAAARRAHDAERLAKPDYLSGLDAGLDIREVSIAREYALPVIDQNGITEARTALGFADRARCG